MLARIISDPLHLLTRIFLAFDLGPQDENLKLIEDWQRLLGQTVLLRAALTTKSKKQRRVGT